MEKQGYPPEQGYPPAGAPPPQQPGYAAPPPGYGAQPPPGYAAPPVTQQPPYGQQPPPQQGYGPPPQQTTVIVSAAPQLMTEHPMNMNCPHCQATIVTRLEYKNGLLVWLCVLGLCLLQCWLGCCLIPLCIDSLKDVDHYCPSCNRIIGSKKKI